MLQDYHAVHHNTDVIKVMLVAAMISLNLVKYLQLNEQSGTWGFYLNLPGHAISFCYLTRMGRYQDRNSFRCCPWQIKINDYPLPLNHILSILFLKPQVYGTGILYCSETICMLAHFSSSYLEYNLAAIQFLASIFSPRWPWQMPCHFINIPLCSIFFVWETHA